MSEGDANWQADQDFLEALREKAKIINGFKLGDRVNLHSCIGGPISYRNRTIRQIGTIPSSNIPVVWVDGVAGCWTIDALSKVDDQLEAENKELRGVIQEILDLTKLPDAIEFLVGLKSVLKRAATLVGKNTEETK